MRHALCCVLVLFLLNRLLYGHIQETHRAIVMKQPNWSRVYKGEAIVLRCEIMNGTDSEWEYEWRTTSLVKPPNENEFKIISHELHDAGYRCRGRKTAGQKLKTQWSDYYKLKIYDYKPRPVISVSPSWLSPGASVTLNCMGKPPSEGWRLYWYKAIVDISNKHGCTSYNYELLPGSINGTDQDSYIIDGQTHTAGYVCRAERGDPVFHTLYSHPQFVWSGDVNPAASLTVSPDTAQHFYGDSVSLSCEGTSTKWRVMRFTDMDLQCRCYEWGKMIGATCTIHSLQYMDAVYWCVSASGEFSNAVNITVHGQKEESSSLAVTPSTGVLTGILLVVLLLMLYFFIKSKDPCMRHRLTHLESTQQANKDETQDRVYCSLRESDGCVYESVRGFEGPGSGTGCK